MADPIALFGGTFNPIHHGHLIIARFIAEELRLAKVLFLPSAHPPHKSGSGMASAAHRAAMVRLAIEGESCFGFDDYDLNREGPSYTIDTIAHFRERLGLDIILYWIIGSDSLTELTSWYRARALVESCRLITAIRPGWEGIDWEPLRARLGEDAVAILKSGLLESPRIDISSTHIRQRIRQRRSVRFLLPESVRQYILHHNLYQS